MDLWTLAIGIGTVLAGFGAIMTPIVIAAFNRERALYTLISGMKDELSGMLKAHTDPLHDRINRVRDEYVRRDDLAGHLERWEKRFDDLRDEMRRGHDSVGKKLDEIQKTLSSK